MNMAARAQKVIRSTWQNLQTNAFRASDETFMILLIEGSIKLSMFVYLELLLDRTPGHTFQFS
jgi:hypothetical protein